MTSAEAAFLLQCQAHRLPMPSREYPFHHKRRWRFDFAWLDRKVAVEIEGGVWTRGRHVRALGYQGDCEKYNEAALDGWTVIRATPAQVDSGQAIEWVKRALKGAIRNAD